MRANVIAPGLAARNGQRFDWWLTTSRPRRNARVFCQRGAGVTQRVQKFEKIALAIRHLQYYRIVFLLFYPEVVTRLVGALIGAQRDRLAAA